MTVGARVFTWAGDGGGGGSPYDAEVEYIESTGTQWIDTGIVPTGQTRAQFKVYGVERTNDVILGFFTGNDWKDWRFFTPDSDYSGMMDVVSGRGYWTGSEGFVRRWLEFEVGNFYVKDLATGRYLYNGSTYQGTFPTDSITLNHYGRLDEVGRNSKNRWAYVKIYDGDTLVLDFIPVRVGSIGYMYDRVSGVLFGNNGTGDFVLGPDK